ncbi:MAG: putative nucleotidyltransferase [Verrucomicrobia bacterium ADurb.Bin122]|nr:MAG: putative nucleotidyltransferase [Verrucomicrobia bacterium ADurb.Bin122]HOD48072.1 nucleotidyltransferase domain-containing protein [Opitutaceae bacterium]HOG93177.1 nucleotidyltransferase domain-containing protein [Opitutaceae bacterium]HOY55436.1 nucleotidyltransferase domain-containing protein [Opitutaceae bacterium]HQL21981.1 nucleotidyltransferase domain-containing protein [Opitutaceae bacterium]
MNTIEASIQARLVAIERERGVKVLFACESGSRAWGFASPDSDYDVRFIYTGPASTYLTVTPTRDVIEEPVNAELDVSGWDLRKALGLLSKSNPPLLEWLDSPIIYRQDAVFAEGFRALSREWFNPRACRHHYVNMARNNHREHMRGDTVKLKKYLYILRPVLACRWLDRNIGPVPMRLEIMLDALVNDAALRAAIDRLLALKRTTPELGEGPAIPEISSFLSEEITHMEATASELPAPTRPISELDAFFQAELARLF